MIDKSLETTGRDIRSAMRRLIKAAHEDTKTVVPPAPPLQSKDDPSAWPKRQVPVNIPLDPDLVAALRTGGKDWKLRANAMLREAMGLKQSS